MRPGLLWDKCCSACDSICPAAPSKNHLGRDDSFRDGGLRKKVLRMKKSHGTMWWFSSAEDSPPVQMPLRTTMLESRSMNTASGTGSACQRPEPMQPAAQAPWDLLPSPYPSLLQSCRSSFQAAECRQSGCPYHMACQTASRHSRPSGVGCRLPRESFTHYGWSMPILVFVTPN